MQISATCHRNASQEGCEGVAGSAGSVLTTKAEDEDSTDDEDAAEMEPRTRDFLSIVAQHLHGNKVPGRFREGFRIRR